MKDFSVSQLIGDGPEGDTRVDLSLTAREVAAFQFVVQLANLHGLIGEAQAHMTDVSERVGHRWNISFRAANARIGIAVARALAPERAPELAVLLADVDQDQASLNSEEDSP